eukprot:scaffold105603_cov57-Phaeocystis_antarctica.AAC.1
MTKATSMPPSDTCSTTKQVNHLSEARLKRVSSRPVGGRLLVWRFEPSVACYSSGSSLVWHTCSPGRSRQPSPPPYRGPPPSLCRGRARPGRAGSSAARWRPASSE